MARESSQHFEYDDSVESDEGDEGYESDEAYTFEADESDEGDESDEVDESDEGDESDEAFQFVESDESDESDEGDENDGVFDPRLSFSGRVQARQAAWRRNVTSMQAADARAARANQRSISQRIQNAARAKTQTLKPLRGANMISLQLPGRPPVTAMMRPAPALASDVNRLRQVLAANDSRQTRALTRLGAAQASGFKSITNRQLKNERDLANKIVQGDNSLNQLVSKETTERKLAIAKHKKRMLAAVKRAEMRQLSNVALVGSSAGLWALYADRSKLTASRNLKFLASNVVWLYSDEIFGAVAGRQKRFASNLAWLSVAGNIATMLYVAKDQQHQRIVTVTRTLDGAGKAEFTAADLGIAKDYQAEFEAFSEVRAVASYIQPPTATAAKPLIISCDNKKLTVTGTASEKIALFVDTWKDNGDL